jgi:hypothetical protein
VTTTDLTASDSSEYIKYKRLPVSGVRTNKGRLVSRAVRVNASTSGKMLQQNKMKWKKMWQSLSVKTKETKKPPKKKRKHIATMRGSRPWEIIKFYNRMLDATGATLYRPLFVIPLDCTVPTLSSIDVVCPYLRRPFIITSFIRPSGSPVIGLPPFAMLATTTTINLPRDVHLDVHLLGC